MERINPQKNQELQDLHRQDFAGEAGKVEIIWFSPYFHFKMKSGWVLGGLPSRNPKSYFFVGGGKFFFHTKLPCCLKTRQCGKIHVLKVCLRPVMAVSCPLFRRDLWSCGNPFSYKRLWIYLLWCLDSRPHLSPAFQNNSCHLSWSFEAVTFRSCCSGIGGSLVPITVLCHHGAGQQRRARFPAGAQTCAVQCKLHWNAGNFSVSGWRGLSAATLSSRLTDLPICSSMVP